MLQSKCCKLSGAVLSAASPRLATDWVTAMHKGHYVRMRSSRSHTAHRTVHCNDANTNKEPSLSDFTGVGFQGNIKLFVKLAPHQLTHTRFHSRIAHRLHFIHNVIIKYEAQRYHESYIVPCVWRQTCQVRRQTVMMTYWLVCVPRVTRTVHSHRHSAVVVLIFSVGPHWRLHN